MKSQEDGLNFWAGETQEFVNQLYGKKMGFALLVFEFFEPGTGDYVSNAQRSDMIKALRETADRLENKEFIPRPIGEA